MQITKQELQDITEWKDDRKAECSENLFNQFLKARSEGFKDILEIYHGILELMGREIKFIPYFCCVHKINLVESSHKQDSGNTFEETISTTVESFNSLSNKHSNDSSEQPLLSTRIEFLDEIKKEISGRVHTSFSDSDEDEDTYFSLSS